MLEKALVTSPTVTLSILRRWLRAFTTWGDIMQGLESGALVDSCNTVAGPPDDVSIAVFPATPIEDPPGPVDDVLPVSPPVKPPAPPDNVLPAAPPDNVLPAAPPVEPPAAPDAVLPAAPSVENPAAPDNVLPAAPPVAVLPAVPPVETPEAPDNVLSDATPVKPFVLPGEPFPPVEPSVAPDNVLPVNPPVAELPTLPASPADVLPASASVPVAAPTVVSDEAPESDPVCCGGVVFPEASTRVELEVESEQLIVNEDCWDSNSVVAADNSWTWYECTSFK